MRDFTLNTYQKLLESILQAGYRFQTFQDFITQSKDRVVVLRHDVDLLPKNALETATLEHALGITGSYYFRMVPQSFDEHIIRQIAGMGHEIGYHYETMDMAGGDVDKAYSLFCDHLEVFRKIYPVKTICMHGSPRSLYDNREIWNKYNYRDLGIIAEPYFDTDFSQVFYLTDTGRRWDGFKVSVRDKVSEHQQRWITEGLLFHSSQQIIQAVKTDNLPAQIMITLHPQRWTNDFFPWWKELILQNTKNIIKFLLIRMRKAKQ